MAQCLRKLYIATLAEALWRNACGGALARRRGKCSGPTPAEPFWHDDG